MSIATFIKRNRSLLLTITAEVGLVSTVIFAVKETPKALEKYENVPESTTLLEKVKVIGPCYISTAIFAGITTACIFGANLISRQQQASLIGAYTLLEQNFRDYQRKLIELRGEETHREILRELAADRARNPGIFSENLFSSCNVLPEDTGAPILLFYDAYSRNYFEATMEQVLNAEYNFNRNFSLRGYNTLDELYFFLGLQPPHKSGTVGWIMDDGLLWVDFNHKKENNGDFECYVLETPWGPEDMLEIIIRKENRNANR